MTSLPTRALIWQAYPGFQADILGLPSWADLERYDITAKVPSDAPPPTEQQRIAMFRQLLSDRYKMLAHTEIRVRQAFNLVLDRTDGRLGPNLKPSTRQCAVPTIPGSERQQALPPCRVTLKGQRFEGETTIGVFAGILRDLVGRPVIDKTNLSGVHYIEFESSAQPFTGTPSRADLPSVFTAVREQLGLRLEATEAQTEILVIDRIERPTEN